MLSTYSLSVANEEGNTHRPINTPLMSTRKVCMLAFVLGVSWLGSGVARAEYRVDRDSALLVGAAVGAVVGLALADADRPRHRPQRHYDHRPHRHDRHCGHRSQHSAWHHTHRPPVQIQHHYHYHKPHRPKIERHEHHHYRREPGYSRTGYRDDVRGYRAGNAQYEVKQSVSYGHSVGQRDSVRF